MIDPLRIYQIKGQVYPLTSAYLAAGVAVNQQLVAASSGQNIRVMGYVVQSTGAGVSVVTWRSGTPAGTILHQASAPAATVSPLQLELMDSGYFETVTGQGLYVDVGTTAGNITVFYIIYTP